MVSFLIPATIVVAAQLSMSLRFISQPCFTEEQAPTTENFDQSKSLLRGIKSRNFLPTIDTLVTISYLLCYSPYYIATLLSTISGKKTQPSTKLMKIKANHRFSTLHCLLSLSSTFTVQSMLSSTGELPPSSEPELISVLELYHYASSEYAISRQWYRTSEKLTDFQKPITALTLNFTKYKKIECKFY